METNQQVQKYNWDFIMTDTYYQVSTTLLDVYEKGEYEELGNALRAMVKNSIASARFELRLEMKELMENILLCKHLPEERTQERWEKICRHRREIESLLEYNSCLNQTSITDLWNSAFEWAVEIVKNYLPSSSVSFELTYNEVFESEFRPYVTNK